MERGRDAGKIDCDLIDFFSFVRLNTYIRFISLIVYNNIDIFILILMK